MGYDGAGLLCRSTSCSTRRSGWCATRRGNSSSDEYLPVVTRALPRTARFRSSSSPRVGALGLLRRQPADRVRLRRAEQRRLRPDQSGARARRLRSALVRQRAVGPGDVPDLRLRLGGAEALLAAAAGARRGDRLLRPHRAGLRLQSGRHADARACRSTAAIGSTAPSAGSPTATSPTSRWCGRRCADGRRRRRARLPRRARPPRVHHPRDAGQVQPARLDHLRALLRGLLRPRGQPSSPACRACAARCRASRRRATASPGAPSAPPSRATSARATTRASASCSRRPIAGYQLVQAKLVDDDHRDHQGAAALPPARPPEGRRHACGPSRSAWRR